MNRRWLNCKHDGSNCSGLSKTFRGIGRRYQSRVSVCAEQGADYDVYEARGRDNCEEEAKNVFSIVTCGEQVVREAFSSALRRNMEEIALKMRSWKVSFLMCNFLLFSFYMIRDSDVIGFTGCESVKKELGHDVKKLFYDKIFCVT